MAVGLAASHVTKRVDEPTIEITLTVTAAYGAFVAAEQVHASGVIATVASGLVCGNVGPGRGHVAHYPSPRWNRSGSLAFALNSIVFLLIGFEVSLGGPPPTGARSRWRRSRCSLPGSSSWPRSRCCLRRTNEAVPRWVDHGPRPGRIRGGLSIVLALGLPRDLPHREQLITMTLGAGALVDSPPGNDHGPLLRRLGLVPKEWDHIALERARAEVRCRDGRAPGRSINLGVRHVVSDGDAEAFRAPLPASPRRRARAIGHLGRQAGRWARPPCIAGTFWPWQARLVGGLSRG
ncbi:MAG: cation:proton antiporter [Gemmatimonadetes bacterium]|nr:cation:proton antiporter [Gemmatimonadota bacterium]